MSRSLPPCALAHGIGSARAHVSGRRARIALLTALIIVAVGWWQPASAGSWKSPRGNAPPVISGTPPTTVVAGQRYLFQPSAADPDGDRLKFSVSNKPFWAAFDAARGTLSGVPAADQLGLYRDVRIVVSDGRTRVALPAFTITVQPASPSVANGAPKISGTPPASVTVGQAYAFRPTASDPDGDALTFSIAGRLAWATFDPRTGALTGTPGGADVGTYGGVTIGVSDGQLSATLAPFTITVAAAPVTVPTVGSAELSWTPPTTRSDGSALSNLAGYRVYYGTTRGAYTQRIDLPSPGITTVLVENLAPGTYYFATTAYDSAGLESSLSVEASKTIY